MGRCQSATERPRSPGSPGPCASIAEPRSCCRGCVPVTSPSSTTSTSTARAPRRSWTPGSRRSSTSRSSCPVATPRSVPALLAEAGILMVDRLEGLQHVPDGARVRIHDEMVYVDGKPVALGRRGRRRRARGGDGAGPQRPGDAAGDVHPQQQRVPPPRGVAAAPRAGPPRRRRPGSPDGRRSWSSTGNDHRAELKRIAGFVRERRPALIGVDRGADALREAGHVAGRRDPRQPWGRAALGGHPAGRPRRRRPRRPG